MSEPQPCFEDEHLLALCKPAGMPTQPDTTADLSLQTWAEQRTRQRLHLINRLDRPVSGIVLLAKIRSAMAEAQRQFRAGQVRKTYIAIVAGSPPKETGTLIHYLTQNPRTHRTYAHESEQPGALRAELHYRLAGHGERYTYLLLQPITGRHHQIRAQLAAIGCPIKGDVRYGARRANPDRSIHLHAWQLELAHPISQQLMRFTAPLPETDSLWRDVASKIPQ